MRNSDCRTWNMVTTVKNVKNGKCTWSMARKLKNVENETQTLFDLEYGEKHSKKGENEKCTLYVLEYGEKTNNHGK